MLQETGIEDKILRLMIDLYQYQRATVRENNEFS